MLVLPPDDIHQAWRGGESMRSRLFPLFLFAAGSASLLAQTQSSQAAPSQNVVAQAQSNASCPVAVMAKYLPDARVVLVGPASKGDSREPLHMSFGMKSSVKDKVVVQATVTVRGMSEKGGVVPANATSSPWLVQTYTVNVGTNAAGVQSGTVWLNGYGGISDVRIDSIRYANGVEWKPAADESCHALTGTVLTSSK
jgi:hypothetical protein